MQKEKITKMELLEIVERQEEIIVKLRKDNIEKENLIDELLKGYSIE